MDSPDIRTSIGKPSENPIKAFKTENTNKNTIPRTENWMGGNK